jgi:hypothetical protein
LPEAAFDLVHTRLVLVHIPQRDEVIPRLSRALRPGGILLLEEPDLIMAMTAVEDTFRPSYVVMLQPLIAAGMDPSWASTMPGRLEAAGLVGTTTLQEPMTFTGGSPLAEFWRITYRQLSETKPFSEAERALLQEGAAAIARPGGSYASWDLITAWGRRP